MGRGAEQQGERGGRHVAERQDGVRGQPREQGARGCAREPPRVRRRGRQGREAEAREPQRVARDVDDRPAQLGHEQVEVVDERAERSLPSRTVGTERVAGVRPVA
jgi:hypothetical protein